MKRFCTAILAGILLMLPQAGLAEGEVEISVTTVAASAKGEAVVEVALDACEGVDSLQFNLNYDPNALSVVRVTPGRVFPAEYCVSNANEPGRIRVACATARGLSVEDSDILLQVVFQTRNGSGSAVTLSDVVATVVDAEYVATRAYLLAENGGVTVNGAPLPAPITTPWIAETPVPTPSPEPDPTPEPTAAVLSDADAASEPTPEPSAPAKRAMLPYLIVGIFSVLALAAIVIILVSSRNSRKRRKRKKNSSAKRRQNS